MNHVTFRASCPESLTTNPNQNTGAGTRSSEAGHPAKRYFDNLDTSGTPDPILLVKRKCRSAVSDQAADHSSCKRELLGGKGMFLWRMKAAGLSVPPFECVTAQIMNALEQHPLDTHRLDHYLSGFVDEPLAKTSLKNLREYLNTLPPSEQTKRDDWLSAMTKFIASDDYYEQVKDSEAARKIRELHRQVDRFSASQPVIVRSSGINEDNYGDAQAGKYLSVIQAGGDVFRTCLKVMASGYRPEVCPEGIPQPMALIIQQCIDCRSGGVIMSYQSFQNDTVRIEYTKGQPKGVVAGQSGNTPHRIDIYRKEGAEDFQYFPGKVSSHFVLHKNNNGYVETEIYDAESQSDDSVHKLSDHLVAKLSQVVTELENLLLCPVDVEFAIDHQGNLFLLQVRPVTRLSGGMDFAMPIPKETLTIGKGVSEGHCTGTLWQAEEQAADSMPDGAIVLAQHAADWMLEPEFLKRAGGFVFAEGGFNDHVAIVMKQGGKTLMLAGGQFAVVAAQVGQLVTLAFARFKGKPCAFIVAGDLSGELASHRSLSSAFSDVPLPGAVPSRGDLSPPEGTFLNVASGFQWLTDQNARLLAMFASGGGLDCLANPIKLSMSPQREELLAEIRVSVNQLVQGAEAFLDGYRAFLQLGRSSVRPLQDEARQLSKRFKTLKRSVLSGLEAIMLPLKAAEKGQGSFRQWVADCQQLQSAVQSLNLKEAEQVRSIHELIFALHQRFLNALAPIALDSGQGRVSRVKRITYVDCTTPSDNVSLLRPSDRSSFEKSWYAGTVVSMDSAAIVNLKLGVHLCLIELLENAEGGKGRTLRLKFSDQFDGNDGVDVSAKFKRMWFLVQLLKTIELNKNAGSMKVTCNAIAGEIVVECPRMKLHQTMQHAFEKLMIALDSMYNLDRRLEGLHIFEGDQWDFNLLAQHLNRDVATAADRFAFQHCLFSMFYGGGFGISNECCQLLSNRLQQFVRHARQLGSCDSLVFQGKKTVDSLKEMFLNDEIAEDIRWEFLHHYILLRPKYAVRVVELVLGYRNHYFVINPSFSYKLEFYFLPVQPLSVNEKELNNVLREHGPEYASQRAKNHYSAYSRKIRSDLF